jgi:hypothetical protein
MRDHGKKEVLDVKRLLAMTVFMTLAFALALSLFGAKDASADAVLAPAFRTDGNFVTFVTVVNKSTNTSLHWMYRYDDPTTTVNDCFHADGFGKTTQNDMFTVDISNTFDSGKPIPSAVDTTSGSYNIGKGWMGYMTLYSFTGTYPGTPTVQGTLNAEVVVASLSTGELYSYKATNDPVGIAEGDFAFTGDINWTFNGVFNPGYATAIWHPTSAINTTWYFLPVTTDLSFGTAETTVAFGDINGNDGFFYDINENLWSASSGFKFSCFAYLTAKDLIAPASLPQAANGGWARIVWIGATDPGFLSPFSMLVYKLETTSSLVSGKTQSAFTSQNRVDF